MPKGYVRVQCVSICAATGVDDPAEQDDPDGITENESARQKSKSAQIFDDLCAFCASIKGAGIRTPLREKSPIVFVIQVS